MTSANRKGTTVLSTVALALAIVSWPVGRAIAAECSPSSIFDGTCSVSGNLNDGAAVLEGTTGSSGSTGGGASTDVSDPASAAPADPASPCLVVVAGRCLFAVDHTTAVQPITLADIAAFRPDAEVDHMEPNGWMIVGLDTNFFATGGTQVKDGTLLAQPASVRFTPRTWHWSYGDGSAASAGIPGTTWAAQGIPEFDPTPTSHVFRAPGTYYIDLTIDYTAEYRFAGTQWVGIAGILPVPANRLVATAGDAKTVLVQRECTVNPAGPGC
ncbi:hypothetical protein BH11ACT4_BH11ACT4_11700 [soil metagenome]